MRNTAAIFSLLIITGLCFYSFHSLMPSEGAPDTISTEEFSAERALIPLKEITRKPHYLGSEEHEKVRTYLVDQLESLGLEVKVQTDWVLDQRSRSIVKPKNIVARLKGSHPENSLMLLSHYDSAKVPSFGASDAGSGIVTILESLRAYLASGATPANDIIVMFTDSEELGLDGADLFVNQHPWAKDVRLALNFEARGSGGPSNMILETNQGNANLIRAFMDAGTKYPVASSLMYSIYKMLPNDTDSTVLREDGDIDGFFFAFIDDHFDYHTANDNFENLDRNTLQHQGSYLLPLLHHFGDADLTGLKSAEDLVYVNFPVVKMISYPFSWILWMLLLAIIGFIVLVFWGISKGRLKIREMGKGFLAFLVPLLLSGLAGFFGWKLLLWIYPQYGEIQHGFTYNGHLYIAFFVFLSLAITFRSYKKFKSGSSVVSYMIAPLFFWLIINTVVFLYLKGAAYFIIPVYFALISLVLLIRQQKPGLLLLTLLTIPAIIFFVPLIQFFPVGLGLKMLVISCVFTVLTFGLVLPVFGFYKWKNFLSLCSLLLAILFFLLAHFKSDFSEERQKPNSLVYYQDADLGRSYWVTYDNVLDDWTRGYLGESPQNASEYIENAAGSKYNTGYAFAKEAPTKEIVASRLVLQEDSIVDSVKRVSFSIIPERSINQLILYTDSETEFKTLTINGVEMEKDSLGRAGGIRNSRYLLSYNRSDSDSLQITYTTDRHKTLEFTVVEYSFDLLTHPQFTINKRPENMMPKPFVNTDAIVVKRSFSTDEINPAEIDSVISEKPRINE
jgi:hypothetical protein